MQGRVRFADDFFKKERNQLYSDWESSFWRELFQNSIDQDASRIDIRLTQGDGTVLVEFTDNGPGMTRQVLEDVYFAIGATTKTGADQIGGMGRARVLTCFSMKSYCVRSQDYLVLGQGGDYEVKNAPYASGCTVSVEVDDTTLENLRKKLIIFLSESRINARIYLNDELLMVRAPLNGRAIRDLMVDGRTFAKVYVNKSANKRLIVRVKGVAMYTTYTDAKAQVVVEIEPDVSRNVLTSNRDGMHYKYSRVLDAFLRELAIDTNSAIRPRFARHTTVTPGGGLKRVVARKKPQPKRRPQVEMDVVQSLRLNGADPEAILASLRATLRDHDDSLPTAIQPTDEEESSANTGAMETRHEDDSYEETVLPTVDFTRWLGLVFGDIYVFDETHSAEMHKSVTSYLPDNWKIRTIGPRRRFRTGGNFVRLLLMWKTAIEYTLEVALPVLGEDETTFGVGFVFSDDALADHRERDGGHVFSLRPVNRIGKLDYKVSDRLSLRRLMVLAQHEVTHVKERYHDEDFSKLRDQIAIRFDEGECLRRMKEALRQMPDLDSDDFLARAA